VDKLKTADIKFPQNSVHEKLLRPVCFWRSW